MEFHETGEIRRLLIHLGLDLLSDSSARYEAQLEGGAADVFGPGGGNGAEPPALDVKSLHARIGELTLENDFLEGALTKAGLLSAKR
jgi:transposase